MDVFHITLCGSRGFNRHITVSQKRDSLARLVRSFVIAETSIGKLRLKHEEHPEEMFSRHQESAKDIDTNKTKQYSKSYS